MNKRSAAWVAETAVMLAKHGAKGRNPSDDAATLHRIAGSLHRYDERACNEDLGCPACQGDGTLPRGNGITPVPGRPERRECPACAGHGLTTGKRIASLERKARAIAEAYEMRAYFQGDPRGCPLYLVPDAIVPDGRDLALRSEFAYLRHVTDPFPPSDARMHAMLRDRWIDSNYNRGRAVPSLR